ncbi:MAG: TetR/AcrR family transcriptional regulator [Gammaproteobacteria bacterium]|nr:TetR/AcrR family transcriptional regulator [Gammaproteobacteria bacterium]
MVKSKTDRLTREDWIRGALDLLSTAGVEGVKIVPLAERLGVTSGSFYWHFKNRRELYDALVDYWGRELTDAAIEATKPIEPPEERIWRLMEQVMVEGLARFDLAIWHWAQSDKAVEKVFNRALKKRFAYAKWMFIQAGFVEAQAEARGRLMVVYMMGESTLINDAASKRKRLLRLKYEILTNS